MNLPISPGEAVAVVEEELGIAVAAAAGVVEESIVDEAVELKQTNKKAKFGKF